MAKLYPLILLLVFSSSLPATDSSTCKQALIDIDRQIRKAGVADTQSTRVAGFPSLRTNRFLASFDTNSLNRMGKLEWLQRSARLGSQGLQVELLNLANQIPAGEIESIKQCQSQLLDLYQKQPDLIDMALQNSKVPHGYNSLARVVGLYWLTRYLTRWRIQVLQQQARMTFGKSQPDELIYAPASKRTTQSAVVLAKLFATARRRSSLKIPTFTNAELTGLFAMHAPYWGIAQRGDSDQPGSLSWHVETISVDSSKPASYQFLSYTRFNGDSLPQLNYVIWFKRRPKPHLLDLYGGKLDSVIWRVTLRSDGQVLLYDSIHSCGCYHKFYTVDEALVQKPPINSQEHPLVFTAIVPHGRNPIIVHLTAATHYVMGLTHYQGETVGHTYSLQGYSRLNNLPYKDGYRNLFSPNGLVKGSKRLERFLLWPMGVPSAGAMRQKGHHLTAFVGKRHFDDADLFTGVFSYQPEASRTR